MKITTVEYNFEIPDFHLSKDCYLELVLNLHRSEILPSK